MHRRQINRVVVDDGHEPDKAIDETLKMIEQQKVFSRGAAELDTMTQQNAALAEQSTAAVTSLRDQAGGLQQVIAAFRLQGQAG